MQVTVRFFARAQDLAGTDATEMALPEGATVAALRDEVVKQFPKLAGFVDRCAIAVNSEFAKDTTVLTEGAEAALLPPVSGG